MQSIDTLRDIRLLRLDRGRILVVSCDSAGGVGPKPFDTIKVSGRVVGKFTARVALMEALSLGALPFCVTVSLSVEPQPTGAQILEGVRNELRHASLRTQITLLSSEKNFAVKQTGLGITVMSIVPPRSLRMKMCKPGDIIVAIGTPQVGKEVISGENGRRVPNTRDVRKLLKIPFVHEMIPVGSQGILREAQILARDSGLTFTPESEPCLDILKSAGPATVTLCAIPSSRAVLLRKAIGKSVSAIGTLS
jgi:hypothetical protein